ERVTVRLVAARAPGAEQPWSADPDDPLRWSAAVAELPTVAAEPDVLPVVVGLLGGGVVVLDLSAVAPVVAVGGDPNTARDLVHAVTAQLGARLPASAVGVAHGVHPRFPGRPMEDLLGDADVRVVVCAAPGADADVERRLGAFAAAGRLRVLVLGDVRGRRSVLRPDVFGVLSAVDALGPVETAMVARAVARAVRSGRLVPPAPSAASAPTSNPPAASTPTPTLPSSPTSSLSPNQASVSASPVGPVGTAAEAAPAAVAPAVAAPAVVTVATVSA
ncbi:hypothetical protein GT354_21595, partial [Streptomyces sp. SID3343]|nr:hypothetical protein [Streptomyces sp. SID3343]